MIDEKKLFIVLPKKEEILFKSRVYPKGKSVKFKDKNIAITLILENSKDIESYYPSLIPESNGSNDSDRASEKLTANIKEQKNMVVKCLIDQDNSPFFDKIKEKYEKDTREICQELSTILTGVENGLKDCQITKTRAGFSKIILAAHLGGKAIHSYLEIQYKINNQLSQLDGMKNVSFVYFSSLDTPTSNEYIHENFPSYSYKKLVSETAEEQFKTFLDILEARADNKEIKFFHTVIPKKLINELISTFLQVSIDCNGIIHLENQHLDTSQYITESFDSSSLKEYLSGLRIDSTLLELDKYYPGIYKELAEKVRGLRECSSCEEFESKFKDFTAEASKIKKSL
jgi:hypothetical protein